MQILKENWNGFTSVKLVKNENVFTVIVDFVNSCLIGADYIAPIVRTTENEKIACARYNHYVKMC